MEQQAHGHARSSIWCNRRNTDAGQSHDFTSRAPRFPLIELLVLTAIIGMLISLLFPSMRARTTNARRTRFTIFLLAGFRAPLQRCAHVP